MTPGAFFGEVALLASKEGLPEKYHINERVVIVKTDKQLKKRSNEFGATAEVIGDGWKGMNNVKILTGRCAGETKSYQIDELRPEGCVFGGILAFWEFWEF